MTPMHVTNACQGGRGGGRVRRPTPLLICTTAAYELRTINVLESKLFQDINIIERAFFKDWDRANNNMICGNIFFSGQTPPPRVGGALGSVASCLGL